MVYESGHSVGKICHIIYGKDTNYKYVFIAKRNNSDVKILTEQKLKEISVSDMSKLNELDDIIIGLSSDKKDLTNFVDCQFNNIQKAIVIRYVKAHFIWGWISLSKATKILS